MVGGLVVTTIWQYINPHANTHNPQPDKDDINTAIRGLCVLTQLGLPTARLAKEVKEHLEAGVLQVGSCHYVKFAHPRP